MFNRRFWVIGGEFRSTDFDHMTEGTERVLGPFTDEREAETAWRTISRAHGHECRTRFAVVQEPLRATTG
jgi:hypothetical protein